jgi:hypothetical protein
MRPHFFIKNFNLNYIRKNVNLKMMEHYKPRRKLEINIKINQTKGCEFED